MKLKKKETPPHFGEALEYPIVALKNIPIDKLS